MPLLPERLIHAVHGAKLLILLVLGITMFAHSSGNESVNPKLADEPGFTVIGIEARTSNAREMTPIPETKFINFKIVRVPTLSFYEFVPNSAKTKICLQSGRLGMGHSE